MNQRNAVQILIIVFICLSFILKPALEAKIITGSGLQDSPNKKPPATKDLMEKFLHSFLKVKEANDKAGLDELVRQTRPYIVYVTVISQLKTGIANVAEGKKGNIYFDNGETIAGLYKNVTNKGGLQDLVKKYKSFTKNMCSVKLRGDDLINEGVYLHDKTQRKAALQKWWEALNLLNGIGDLNGESLTLSNIGKVYIDLAEYSKALDYFKQSLSICRMIGDMRGETINLNGIGQVFIFLSKYSEALDTLKLSLSINKRNRDSRGEAHSLELIGRAHKHLGNNTGALDALKLSLSIYRRHKDERGEAAAMNALGDIYSRLGNFTEALNSFNLALSISKRIQNAPGKANSYLNLGILYNSLGNYQKALEYYSLSLPMFRKIGNARGEASCLNNIGIVYNSLGKYTLAISCHILSEAIFKKIGHTLGEAASSNNIGEIYYNNGKYSKALNYYKASLSLQRRIGDVEGEAISLNNIGRTLTKLGDYSSATKILIESINLSEQLGDPNLTWEAYFNLGNVYRNSGKSVEAVRSYETAVENIERLYLTTGRLKEEERSAMIGKSRFVYSKFIELLTELHRKSPHKGYNKKAFTISEKAKSRIFIELMAKSGARADYAGDTEFQKIVLEEQQKISRRSQSLYKFAEKLSNPKRGRADSVIKAFNQQYLVQVEKELEAKYPRYADLKRPKTLSVEELQEILKPGETLVTYSVGKDKSAAFIIGKKQFQLIELAVGRKELIESIKRFRKGLAGISNLKDLEKFKPGVSHQLYRDIFLPVVDRLAGAKKLYISADDILYTLPFEALVDKEFDLKAFREARKLGRRGQSAYLGEYANLHYLIDSYNVAYLASASVLRSLRKYSKPGFGRWSKPIIAFADPIFAVEQAMIGADGESESKAIRKETRLTGDILTRATGEGKLVRLKDSAREAQAIAQEIKGDKADIYLREKATEENIRKAKLKEARYLLFSTHGLIGGDFSGVAEPSLALTLVGNPPGRDGFLTMSEVLGLDLNADLVVLSACNTYGKGDRAGHGEGFAGLTRSFMYAGARSILVTHWSVESQTARELMVDTFRNLKQDSETKTTALWKAKLKMRNSIRDNAGTANGKLSLSHPFFWAPFVMVGESE